MNLTAKPNTQYRAKIELGFFEQVVSNDTIKGKLEAVGLKNVSVSVGGRTRWAFGTWTGEEVTVELPDQITEVEAV